MTIFRIVLFILIVAYVYLLIKSRLKPKVVRTAAVVIVLSGIVLNMVGLSMEPYAEGWMTMFMRSILMTLQMFLYHFEIFEMPVAQRTLCYLDLYFFVVAAAVLTSISAIILLFGKRARTLLILALRQRKFRHVFIGVNSRSVVVAKGIKNEETAFIEFPSDKEEENLAIVEHTRYARYLSAHGYSLATEDDDAFKTNHQICSWAELKDEDRQYHRDMAKAKLIAMQK